MILRHGRDPGWKTIGTTPDNKAHYLGRRIICLATFCVGSGFTRLVLTLVGGTLKQDASVVGTLGSLQDGNMPKVATLLRVDNWIKFHGAEDQNGKALNPRADTACKYCLAGAIYRCYLGEGEFLQLERVADYIRKHYDGAGQNCMNVITAFNDYQARWADIENIIKELDL